MKLRLTANLVFASAIATSASAAASVSLEMATEQGLQITAPQEWLQLLTAIGIHNVRIRGARAGDEPAIDSRGSDVRPRYHVLGILTARGQLRLPGATFGRGDRVRIKDYFERLAADGAESLSAKRGPYGLAEKDLAAVFAELTQPIDFATKGQPLRAAMDRLDTKLNLSFAPDSAVDLILRAGKPIGDELQGVAVGTGLAILLRREGLVMRPEKLRGQPVALRITSLGADALMQSTVGKESETNPTHWPIGWQPDEIPGNLAPSLSAEINAEIDGYTLAETLAALQPRIKLPMYLDHAVLAASRIDPNAVKVKLPRTRTFYKRVIDRVLAQARLGASLRVDEAGRPFLWITR
jgi:hypothetical protein